MLKRMKNLRTKLFSSSHAKNSSSRPPTCVIWILSCNWSLWRQKGRPMKHISRLNSFRISVRLTDSKRKIWETSWMAFAVILKRLIKELFKLRRSCCPKRDLSRCKVLQSTQPSLQTKSNNNYYSSKITTSVPYTKVLVPLPTLLWTIQGSRLPLIIKSGVLIAPASRISLRLITLP